MTSILFIHGIGVRGSGLKAYLDPLRRGLQQIRPEMPVQALAWGDAVGGELLAGGISIPQGHPLQLVRTAIADSTTSETESSRDPQIQLWEILDSSPLMEIAALTAQSEPGTQTHDANTARPMADRLGQILKPGTRLHDLLQSHGLDGTAMAAATQLVASDEFTGLVGDSKLPAQAKTARLARAFVALALSLRDTELGFPTPLDGRGRQALEVSTAQALLPDEVSAEAVHAQFGEFLLEKILRAITRWAADHRKKFLEQHAAQLADALKYLSRGQSLRQLIASCLDELADEQVIVIAHSLGAVAVFDLLLESPNPKVLCLVAVATQSGLLFEMDALPGASFDEGYPVPQDFPATHIVYDREDLLAYTSGALSGPALTNHRIDNRASFPRNHAAYFSNDDFYALLDRLLPKT